VKIDVRTTAPLKMQTPCLVVTLWQNAKLDGAAAKLNKSLNGLIAEVVADDGFQGSIGETRVLYTNQHEGVATPRVILLGLGKRENFRRPLCAKRQREPHVCALHQERKLRFRCSDLR
jgi:leucyl aminopeptidase